MKKTPHAVISVVWVKQKKLSFYHLYPKRLEKKNIHNCERFFLKTFVLSIVNIWFVSFPPYLRFFQNHVFDPVWKLPHLRRSKLKNENNVNCYFILDKKALKTPVKINKVKSNLKPAQKKKASLKQKKLGTKPKKPSKKKAEKRKSMARKRGKK